MTGAAPEHRSVWCERALLPAGVADSVAIAIAGGRYSSVTVGVTPEAGAERRHGLTIPGAANAHSHAFHRALRHRSQTDRGTFWTWRERMYDVAGALDPDRYHRLARAVFGEMVLAGFTCVGEFHYVHHRPDGTRYGDPNAMGLAVSEAARAAGIRLTLLDTVYLRGGLGDDGHLPLSPRQRRFGDGSVDTWIERVEQLGAAGHARIGAAVHSVRAVDAESIVALARWTGSSAAPLHVHVSEQPVENEQSLASYGCTPVELLDRSGALGPRTTAVHATHLTDADVAALGRSGASVCLCPTTERDLGDGVGPAGRLAHAGVPLSIGTDSHAVVDPFEEARLVELHERLVGGRRGSFGTDELATTMFAGHAALGWDDAGSIVPGNRADLVTVSMATSRTAGAGRGSSLEALVYAASAADVTHVTVDGVDVVEHGRHRTLDVTAELQAAIAEVVP